MECRMSCPDGKVLYNHTCIQSCPNGAKYQYGGICITMCPSDSPFGVVDMNNRCVKGCEDGKLYHNGHCVYSFECNITMIEFEGQCLERCPQGYRFSFTNDFLKDSNVIVALSVILTTLIAILAYNRKIIVDYGRVWRLLIRWRPSGVQEFLKILEQPEPFQFEIDHDPVPVMFHNPNINDDDEPLIQLEKLT
ncbi:uncharacterized protein LOC127865108 [Dreissena polymorpha]|uniref:uncharacterized protein LOC127865108 n=1 Tax=Dreissena polymorpha TaxID=45954 RepID=UPI002264E491|nr:uncharacterized protein LOC127865108 [Dreissena polymorpha]